MNAAELRDKTPDQLREELHRHRLAGDDAQRVVVVHAEEAVAMDDPPITPIRKKRKSSIRIAAQLVRDGEADALVSAGNTGAAMIAAKMVMGTVDGVEILSPFRRLLIHGRHHDQLM